MKPGYLNMKWSTACAVEYQITWRCDQFRRYVNVNWRTQIPVTETADEIQVYMLACESTEGSEQLQMLP